ncbi:5-(carboxyamino)imidazole ribonucleotide synthase [Sinobacterium caligoides]|uniref:N5-carboxyaminoimidazole ribonucleotide synthase n=1 Tax=Sinobacterium caligoides TaxID=933926 RepID=A0A3N2DNB3_9GAMM|nr:5-(carboxyamino)imidazole ribonucleotide synthase [Sinobacterium caligoides]ROS01298.1 5-(carboxyamino)imidazole ribonucleotide synthase [Sinobacterium caligoides]
MKALTLGSGQLSRMLCLGSTPLNIATLAYDVREQRVVYPVSGDDTGKSFAEAIAWCDVITAEFEHIPEDVLSLADASGKLRPSADAIRTGGDRRREKQMLDNAGVASASYRIIDNKAQYQQAIDELGLPLVLKTAKEGYDGKGQWRLKKDTDIATAWPEIEQLLNSSQGQQAIVAEKFVDFDRELSMIGVRHPCGKIKAYPLTLNHHIDGVLALSVALGDNANLQQQATEKFAAIAESLDYVGVLAIEFFDCDGELLVNEIAPRVHNSGHWTQQGCYSSQFDNHMRAIFDIPIGDTQLIQPTAMINILGEDHIDSDIYCLEGVNVHWYGKGKRAGRKMGHLNVSASSYPLLIDKIERICTLFPAAKLSNISELFKL